jgi:hypothetical protein
MKQEKNFFIILVVVILIVIGVMLLKAPGKSSKPPAIALNSGAKIEMPLKFADLGSMKVSEEKFADFEIKNSGTQPLKIFRVFTSCDCTFAKIFINGKESPEFNMEMHSPMEALRWQGEVLPSATATLRVIYKPLIMPVFGPIERSVMFSTNDPDQKQVQVDIKAIISK